MTYYINKDVDERLDYVFIREGVDDIVSFTLDTSSAQTISIYSAAINTSPITDDQGNEYPANRAIIIWLYGGTANTVETLRFTYTTAAGRIQDEEIKIRLVGENQ